MTSPAPEGEARPARTVGRAASALRRALSPRAREERHRERLAEALDLIDHQRRVADAILDTVDVGLVLLDEHGHYQSMNRRQRDFLRLAFPDGHAGRAGQLGLVWDEDGTTLLAESQMPSHRAARGEEFDDCRIWVGDDPRTWRALSVSARAVRDDEGRFTGAALAYKDVTEFMRALRVKDEFVASVSHELRTPLTSIRGYVDLLRERDDLPADASHFLGVVARNAERLGRLVADLLHSAQVDVGPMHVVRTRGDLAHIVREAVSAAEPAAAVAGRRGRSRRSRRSCCWSWTATGCAQVVDNLVSNALKYTPRGGRVMVRLRPDGERVELAVRDTGIGISAPDRDRLFTRFFRARQAAERNIQGVGLGLSIAHSIVESHGGRIEVESQLGEGSVFRVRIPRDDPASPSCSPRLHLQRGQVPKISSVWLTSAYPCSLGDAPGPLLDGRSLHLDRGAAAAAHQVVVMGAGAAAVARLAVLGPAARRPRRLGEQLQGAVDRRQAHGVAPAGQQLVDLLATEVGSRRGPRQHVGDRLALVVPP